MAQSLHLIAPSTPIRSLSSTSTPTPTSLSLRLLPLRHHHLRRLPSIRASAASPDLLSSTNGITAAASSSAIDVDAVTEAELKENGFRSTRRTKLVCTVGPATCGADQLEALAVGGMNVARVNMCHGTHEWHREVIRQVRRLNEEKGYAVAVMMDTEGSEIHMGDLGGAPSAKAEVNSNLLIFFFENHCRSKCVIVGKFVDL